MADNESLTFFLRFVRERHDALKELLNEMFKALALDVHDEKVRANESLLEACRDLEGTLSEPDRPKWLTASSNATTTYPQNHKNEGQNFRLLNNIFTHKNATISHAWSFDDEANEADYRFDEIYERFKKDSRLPELFDSLVDTLDRMIDSGEIDSLSALRSLEQLISVIKQKKGGSYFSVMASWEFISGFLKNLVWQELTNLPGLKQLKSAFENTAKEMDIEIETMHSVMAEGMKKRHQTRVQSLTSKRKGERLLENKADDE